MTTEPRPRVALVTGASRGIGAATAVALAEAGHDIAINYMTNVEAAGEVASRVRALGRRAEIYQADISKMDECGRMVEKALSELSRIDILVNNAGIARMSGDVADADPAELLEMFAHHVLGPLYLCKLLVPQMRQLPRGDIVMVSSMVAQTLPAKALSYNIAKTAMEALAHTLAKEEREHCIRVNIVAPTVVETDMGNRYAQKRGFQSVRDLHEYFPFPFGFVCQPSDIANAIVFLCSEGGRYVTDQRINVNGGAF